MEGRKEGLCLFVQQKPQLFQELAGLPGSQDNEHQAVLARIDSWGVHSHPQFRTLCVQMQCNWELILQRKTGPTPPSLGQSGGEMSMAFLGHAPSSAWRNRVATT